MAKTKYTPKATDKVYADGTVIIGGNRKEKVTVPKLPGEKYQVPVFASVDGQTALIERGTTISVSKPIAKAVKDSLVRSEKASEYYYEKSNG